MASQKTPEEMPASWTFLASNSERLTNHNGGEGESEKEKAVEAVEGVIQTLNLSPCRVLRL